jgi:hypothetical protein
MTVENGFRPEPSVFDDAKVAAEAVPTKDGFCRRIFRPEPSAFDDARVAVESRLDNSQPLILDDAKVAAKAAPTKRRFL